MKLLIQNYGAHQCELRKHDKYGRFENTGANCEHYAMSPWGSMGPKGPMGPWGPMGLGIANFKIIISGSIANCGAANSFIVCRNNGG